MENMGNNTDTSGQLEQIDTILILSLTLIPVVLNLAYSLLWYLYHQEETPSTAVSVKTIPVGLSLSASYLSANTMMGAPGIVLQQGATYWYFVLAFPLAMLFVSHVFIPVTYKLNLTDIYEYLELRFSKWMRVIGAFMFCLLQIIYISIVLKGPSIFFEQIVRGLDKNASVVVTGLICSLYTAVCGIKQVTYTEAFQWLTMLVGIVALLITVYTSDGNIPNLLETRNETATSMLQTKGDNYTIASIIIGGTVLYTAIYAVNQSQVQRYFSCSTLKSAQRSLWINCACLMVLVILCCFFGAYLTVNVDVNNPDNAGIKMEKIVARFIINKVQTPGVAGLFIAGIFCATMSSVSCGLSATNKVMFRNLLPSCLSEQVKKIFPKCISEKSRPEILKSVSSFLLGIFCIVVAIIDHHQGILMASFSFYGIFCCPIFGVFILGVFFPFVHKRGAFTALLFTVPFLLWILIGNYESTAGSLLWPLYRINFLWYGPIGVTMVIFIGIITSRIMGNQDPTSVSRKLLSPLTLWIMDKFVAHNRNIVQEEINLEPNLLPNSESHR